MPQAQGTNVQAKFSERSIPLFERSKRINVIASMILSLEQIILQAIDVFLEKNETQVDKIIADMFKAVILRKYQESFNQEVAQGIVHAENVDKTIDYCFAELCVCFRTQQNSLSDTTKDFVINKVKEGLPQIRCIAHEILKSQGVHIIR